MIKYKLNRYPVAQIGDWIATSQLLNSRRYERLMNCNLVAFNSDCSRPCELTLTPLKRGVKTGTKRGKYRAYSTENKRIIFVAEEYEGDWKSAVIDNGVSIGAAYAWIRESKMEAKKRGGAKRITVTEQRVEKMIEYVSENPLITLKEIKDKIQAEYDLTMSTTNIHKHMEGKFYTVKKIRFKPATMNCEENKTKRAYYVSHSMEESGK